MDSVSSLSINSDKWTWLYIALLECHKMIFLVVPINSCRKKNPHLHVPHIWNHMCYSNMSNVLIWTGEKVRAAVKESPCVPLIGETVDVTTPTSTGLQLKSSWLLQYVQDPTLWLLILHKATLQNPWSICVKMCSPLWELQDHYIRHLFCQYMSPFTSWHQDGGWRGRMCPLVYRDAPSSSKFVLCFWVCSESIDLRSEALRPAGQT